MGRKKEVIFAECNGELYVQVEDSGINFFALVHDGAPLTLFGEDKKKKPHIKVEDAIAWHEKELRETKGMSGSLQALEALKKVMEKFKAGKVVDA